MTAGPIFHRACFVGPQVSCATRKTACSHMKIPSLVVNQGDRRHIESRLIEIRS